MKVADVAFLLIFLMVLPASAFELKNPQREEPRLKIEIEAESTQVQKDFDNYVQELAATARRDADSPPEKKDRVKELQAKALNPAVLYRW
jgi:hypothetical protein